MRCPRSLALWGTVLLTCGAARLITGLAEDAPRPAPNSVPLRSLGADDKSFVIEFPTAAERKETAWKIIWDVHTGGEANKEGFKFDEDRANKLLLFRIKQAYFRPGAGAPWVQVLEDAHV